jgi:NAD(P)-dependent dehydrogenase (short-subunit alcohol dehydrogenase family)
MDTFDLAEDLRTAGVTVNALHPATFMPTKVSPAKPISTIAQGVAATVRVIKEETGTGRYFNSLEASHANDQAYDAAARSRLRAVSRELAGL